MGGEIPRVTEKWSHSCRTVPQQPRTTCLSILGEGQGIMISSHHGTQAYGSPSGNCSCQEFKGARPTCCLKDSILWQHIFLKRCRVSFTCITKWNHTALFVASLCLCTVRFMWTNSCHWFVFPFHHTEEPGFKATLLCCWTQSGTCCDELLYLPHNVRV